MLSIIAMWNFYTEGKIELIEWLSITGPFISQLSLFLEAGFSDGINDEVVL